MLKARKNTKNIKIKRSSKFRRAATVALSFFFYRYICSAGVSLKNVNNLNYMGVENTIFLARKRNPKISRKSAKKVVRSCVRC